MDFLNYNIYKKKVKHKKSIKTKTYPSGQLCIDSCSWCIK